MQYLWRALKSTFEYKFTIFASFFCAVVLALCWGGNITAVYPLVQISFQGETVPEWLGKKIAEKNDNIQAVQTQVVEIEKQLSAASQDNIKSIQKEKSRLDDKIAKYQQELSWLNYAKPYVDQYAPNDPFMTIVWLMMFVIVGTLVKSVFTFLHGYYSTKIGQLGSLKIREEFFRKMLGYEVNHFSNRGVSDAMSRFTGDMGSLSGGISLFYGKLVREPFKMIVCVAGAIYISWQLFLFTCLFLPLVAFLIMWMAKALKRVVKRSMEEMARLYERIEETFCLIRVVKAFNREDNEAKRFHDTNLACYRRGMKIAKYGSLVSPVTECLGTIMMIVAVLVGAYLVTHGKTTIFGIPMTSEPLDLGTLILFYGFLLGAADPARRLSDFFLNIQSAVAAADRIYVMIDRVPAMVETQTPKPLAPFHDKLEFDHVSFTYYQYSDEAGGAGEVLTDLPDDPNRVVLHDVSLSIRYGETVAIVGPSGCGKSTLLNLIPRFCDPTRGVVSIDSIPLPEVSSRDLRDQIGLVTQETTLFNDTVFENIRYGVPDATMEQVVEAAKR
ncbi:MAG: ABC transporter transmembrane domain-containing protein, partial [Planctomycetia bacterium]|nr:ABC transporter transmembrane domain-containing protein [Planctomycetia bacterium]